VLKPTHFDLAKLARMPRNAREHDLGTLSVSMQRFGFLQRVLVNRETGHLIAGAGRVNLLQGMKAREEPPPEDVAETLDSDGTHWMVPGDLCSIPADQEEAAALALNRIGENEWNDELLKEILSDLKEQDQLPGTGFDADDLDRLFNVEKASRGGGGRSNGNELPQVATEMYPVADLMLRDFLMRGEELPDNLTASIADRGIVVPLIVRPQEGTYQILDGMRRYKIARTQEIELAPIRTVDVHEDLAYTFVLELHNTFKPFPEESL